MEWGAMVQCHGTLHFPFYTHIWGMERLAIFLTIRYTF